MTNLLDQNSDEIQLHANLPKTHFLMSSWQKNQKKNLKNGFLHNIFAPSQQLIINFSYAFWIVKLFVSIYRGSLLVGIWDPEKNLVEYKKDAVSTCHLYIFPLNTKALLFLFTDSFRQTFSFFFFISIVKFLDVNLFDLECRSYPTIFGYFWMEPSVLLHI